MTPDKLVLVTVSALLAAVPLEAFLWVRLGRTRFGAPLSPGRFLLFYAIVFGAVLTGARLWALPGALTVAGLVAGLVGTGRGVHTLYRLLYGDAWSRSNRDAVQQDVARWQLALMVLAVGFITAAVALTYAPSNEAAAVVPTGTSGIRGLGTPSVGVPRLAPEAEP